jgi:hypothetical protein
MRCASQSPRSAVGSRSPADRTTGKAPTTTLPGGAAIRFSAWLQRRLGPPPGPPRRYFSKNWTHAAVSARAVDNIGSGRREDHTT